MFLDRAHHGLSNALQPIVRHDDGMGYCDYVETLAYLLFLKMAEEQLSLPYTSESDSSNDFDMSSQHAYIAAVR
jgi:hypothetical protein